MILDIINWLTSINFDDLIFHKSGPFLLTIIYFALSLYLVFKIKRDLESRVRHTWSRLIWILFVLAGNIPAYIIYLLLRPAKVETYLEEMEQKYLELETKGIGQCTQCSTTYFPDEMFCKKCGNQIRKHCVRCDNVIEVTSLFCSYCGLQSIEKPKIESKFHRLMPRKLLQNIHMDFHIKENILEIAKKPLEKIEKRLSPEPKNEYENDSSDEKAVSGKENIENKPEDKSKFEAHDIVLKSKNSDILPS